MEIIIELNEPALSSQLCRASFVEPLDRYEKPGGRHYRSSKEFHKADSRNLDVDDISSETAEQSLFRRDRGCFSPYWQRTRLITE
jgi:hypothetical protein